MQVGDLVRWKAHEGWERGGLGTVVEKRTHRWEPEATITEYRIMWHLDVEDIRGYEGFWYPDDTDEPDGEIENVEVER